MSRVPSGLQREKDGRDKVSRELENWKARETMGKEGAHFSGMKSSAALGRRAIGQLRQEMSLSALKDGR